MHAHQTDSTPKSGIAASMQLTGNLTVNANRGMSPASSATPSRGYPSHSNGKTNWLHPGPKAQTFTLRSEEFEEPRSVEQKSTVRKSTGQSKH